MRDAGISDPDSSEGIDFCVEHCPYEFGCIVFEQSPTLKQVRVKGRATLAKALRAHQVSVEDIALILGARKRTIIRDLKK